MGHGTLDEYVTKAVKRYSSLFRLPSQVAIIALLGISCLFGAILTILPICPSYNGLTTGITFGGAFLFLTLASDFTISRGSMKSDPIFNLRRCSALSLFSSLIWFGITFLGSLASVFAGDPSFWVKSFLLGFSGALMLRLLVFSMISFAEIGNMLFSSILQPALCIISTFSLESVVGHRFDPMFLIFLLASIVIVVFTVFSFTYFLDRGGKRTLGVASSRLFRAFFANWAESLNEPLETFFERLGSEQNIKVSLLTFKTNEKTKAVIVVTALHPGPFKNLGSSLLPFLIQTALENKLQCVVSVPHGLVGHDFDLSSQFQNQRVVEGILSLPPSSRTDSGATIFVRNRKEEASASCQIFGDWALLTLTVAPKTMEDLPQELDSLIVKEAEKRGVPAVVIDAHNSIDGSFNTDEAVISLRKASVAGLEKAVSHGRFPFEVGAAAVVPKEFTTKEGMGPGGVSVITIRVGDQRAAYITIDGNNMMSGLREKILSELKEIGIVDGEVLTTDTHAVCGLVRTARGYHPVGEVIDDSELIGYIKRTALKALEDLEPAEASWVTGTISNVKVIGANRIEELCLLADKTAKEARRLAVSLFSVATALLLLLLTFF